MPLRIGLRLHSLLISFVGLASLASAEQPALPASDAATELPNVRRPESDEELRRWLENMVWHHRFSDEEIRLATGLELSEIRAARKRLGIDDRSPTARQPGQPLRLLPYPGGRHPRIGFLEGAINPQRETKASIFTPWDPHRYIVLDVPEAIFTNLGLTYLAHTHIPTIWDEQHISLPVLEWKQENDGRLAMQRKLPNGISFGTRLTPHDNWVDMDFWITNGTTEPLRDMRVQMCVMLRGAPEFASQTNDNKLFWKNYAACRNDDGAHWVIFACTPPGRVWGNPRCPCLHSDPVFAKCEPGASVRARGRLSFYEGRDIDAELQRIEATQWQIPAMAAHPCSASTRQE